MRRDSFQAELTAACDGFAGVSLDAWLWGDWHSDEVGDASINRPDELAVVAPLRKRRNLAAEEFSFVRACLGQARLPADQGHAAEPDAVRQLVVARALRRGVPSLDAFIADVVTRSCATRSGSWSGSAASTSSSTRHITRCLSTRVAGVL